MDFTFVLATFAVATVFRSYGSERGTGYSDFCSVSSVAGCYVHSLLASHPKLKSSRGTVWDQLYYVYLLYCLDLSLRGSILLRGSIVLHRFIVFRIFIVLPGFIVLRAGYSPSLVLNFAQSVPFSLPSLLRRTHRTHMLSSWYVYPAEIQTLSIVCCDSWSQVHSLATVTCHALIILPPARFLIVANDEYTHWLHATAGTHIKTIIFAYK